MPTDCSHSAVDVVLGRVLGAALGLPNLLAVAAILLAAVWTTGGRAQRLSGLALGGAALMPAWLIPADQPLVRGVSALIAFVGNMRLLDLRRGDWTLRRRLAHVVSVVDTRRLVRAPSRLDARSLSVGLFWLAVAGAAVGLLVATREPPGAPFWLHRWVCALAIVYAGVSAGYALTRAGYATLGFATGPLHSAPLMSRTVQELWGERWARPVSAWLLDTCVRPFARRRRPILGYLLAFAISAVFHAYAVWVALGLVRGLAMAASMLGFFAAQGAVIGIERALGVRTWRPSLGRAWTVTWMLATAPLFLEPTVRVLGLVPP